MAIKQGETMGRSLLANNDLERKSGPSKNATRKGGQARTPLRPRRSSPERLPQSPPLLVEQSFPRNSALPVRMTGRKTQLNAPLYEVLMAIKNMPNLMRRPSPLPPY